MSDFDGYRLRFFLWEESTGDVWFFVERALQRGISRCRGPQGRFPPMEPRQLKLLPYGGAGFSTYGMGGALRVDYNVVLQDGDTARKSSDNCRTATGEKRHKTTLHCAGNWNCLRPTDPLSIRMCETILSGADTGTANKERGQTSRHRLCPLKSDHLCSYSRLYSSSTFQ